MFHTTPKSSPILALSFLALVGCDSPLDRVVVQTPIDPGERIGVLIDGWRNSGYVDDEAYVPASTNLGVPNLESNALYDGEVVVFGRDHAPWIERVTWTPGADRIEPELDAALELVVTVWIASGPFEAQRQRAAQMVELANQIYREERAGLVLVPTYYDVTDYSDLEAFENFTCSRKQEVREALGYEYDQINIYLLDEVHGSKIGSIACKAGAPDFVGLGAHTADVLLAHELGFLFSLSATTDFEPIGPTNVMHRDNTWRRHLTEGQVLRMHINPQSAINSVYQVREGRLIRDCRAVSKVGCPALELTLWDDE